METLELQKLAAQKFQTPDGSIVDVLYATSDGKLFFTEEEAGQPVTPIYRDKQVREIAKSSNALKQIILATDWLKARKAVRQPPSFDAYTAFCSKYKYEAVSKVIYEFIESKVFAKFRPYILGEKDTIFTWNYGIVKATLLKRYAQGQVWQMGHELIFTCPTNTELMSGTYQQIFKPLLDEVQVVK